MSWASHFLDLFDIEVPKGNLLSQPSSNGPNPPDPSALPDPVSFNLGHPIYPHPMAHILSAHNIKT